MRQKCVSVKYEKYGTQSIYFCNLLLFLFSEASFWLDITKVQFSCIETLGVGLELLNFSLLFWKKAQSWSKKAPMWLNLSADNFLGAACKKQALMAYLCFFCLFMETPNSNIDAQ